MVNIFLLKGSKGPSISRSRDDMMGKAKSRRKAIESKVGKMDASIEEEEESRGRMRRKIRNPALG